MRHLLSSSLLFFTCIAAPTQTDMVLIHIKLVNGLTGLPMKARQVGLEDRAGYRDISAPLNESGEATLRIRQDATVLVHNTHEYVGCGDERGGRVHNDYKVSVIFSTGIVEPIEQPNRCGKTFASLKPGELTLFVRPWNLGEEI